MAMSPGNAIAFPAISSGIYNSCGKLSVIVGLPNKVFNANAISSFKARLLPAISFICFKCRSFIGKFLRLVTVKKQLGTKY